MTEDEAKAVAEFAALCVWDSMDHWRPIMRYGRLFTPGTTAGGPDPDPDHLAANAYRLALDKGLLYAEGYIRFSAGFAGYCAWCLDGETVVSPGFRVPVTAYFGVALRPDYVRRVYEARQRYRAGDDGFRWVFQPRHEVINPPLDLTADIVGDLGRGIPSRVREWAVTTRHPSGSLPEAEAWLREELLGSADAGAVQAADQALAPPAAQPEPDTGAAVKDPGTRPSQALLPRPYARYLIRRVDGAGSGMALVCNGPGADGYSDDAVILGEPVQEGDTLDTLIRIADEHRLECEWAVSPGGEQDEHPGLAAHQPAEVHLKWIDGSRAGDSFAVLHRLDYNVWDAWRQPPHPAGQGTTAEKPERLTRNGDSYEMALAAVFRAMGDAMPEEFTVVCL
jgi:hypothetical protein